MTPPDSQAFRGGAQQPGLGFVRMQFEAFSHASLWTGRKPGPVPL